jgi:hypothetical protein
MKRFTLSFTLLLLSAFQCFAVDFSAQVFTETTLNKNAPIIEDPRKVFISGDKERVDVFFKDGSFKSISIKLFDKKISYYISEKWDKKAYSQDTNKVYSESTPKISPLADSYIVTNDNRPELGKKIGREKINGELCDKYRAHEDVGGGNGYGVVYWVSKDNIIVKAAKYTTIGKKTEFGWDKQLKNIKRGPQPLSLFKVPPGIPKDE